MVTTESPVSALPVAEADETTGLVVRQLSKSYAGITVVNAVDLHLRPGTVLGLVGENGAGKSTTSSMIAGLVTPDHGEMTIDGEPYAPKSPADALRQGVALIHQEIRMVPRLTVAENIFLGRLPMRFGRVDRGSLNRQAAEILTALGSSTDPRRPVEGLSMAQQQEIEIAKALTREPKYVIFDEPSASLGQEETERIFDQISLLRERGAAVIYISHRLDEVTRISDSIVCLRDGVKVAEWDTGDVPKADIMRAMVGREFRFGHTEPAPAGAETVLEVSELGRSGVFEGVSFGVRRGEILGVAGLIGAGRTELVRTIAGADRADTGRIALDGRDIRITSPQAAIRAGIAMVPEDRKGQGLLLDRSSVQNIALPWERALARLGFITRRQIAKVAEEQRRFLDIRGRLDIRVGALSGGNQQKVLLGRWLVRSPKVLILDEPTRGVDVGAKMKIYDTIRALAADGVAVIVVSSELEEVLGLAHRVLVMAGGRATGLLDRAEATPERVVSLFFGAETASAAPIRTLGQ